MKRPDGCDRLDYLEFTDAKGENMQSKRLNGSMVCVTGTTEEKAKWWRGLCDRYDYLEFTDAKGVKVRYDQKVGTNKWPKQVHFTGPHLHFIFRSDSSNTEWGYKFKVSTRETEGGE